MKRVLLSAIVAAIPIIGVAAQSEAQSTSVCDGNGVCPSLSNDISNSLFITNGASATVMVTGTIQTRPPAVANSMVYKDSLGVIRTASNTYVSNTGTANESLIAVNVSASVLNTNLLKLSSNTLATCNASTAGTIGLSGTKVCVCDGTSYKNLLGGTCP